MLFTAVRSLRDWSPTQTVRIITFLAGRIKKTDWTEVEHFCLISGKGLRESAKGFCEEKLSRSSFSLSRCNDSLLKLALTTETSSVYQFSALMLLFFMICKYI